MEFLPPSGDRRAIFVLKMRKRVDLLEHLRVAQRALAARAGRRRRRSPPRRRVVAPDSPRRAARSPRRMTKRASTHGSDRRSRCPAGFRPTDTPSPARASRSASARAGSVWIGGLALALGGIFLVQFSIEAGLIGPGVRIFLGGLLAAALIAAGEWTRRNDQLTGFAGVPTAHIPSILTAAGTTVAYATIYAAYALYDFLVPGTAFVLLGIVALATLAAALLHGPALAALGQIGAFVAPLLGRERSPELLGALHLSRDRHRGLVRARARAAVALARHHGGAFGTLWMRPGSTDARRSIGGTPPRRAAFALAAAWCPGVLRPGRRAGEIDPISSVRSAPTLCATLLVLASSTTASALAAFTLLSPRRRDRVAHRSRGRRPPAPPPCSRSS
jgi:uncharacterized membrane protein